jgi:AmiR/NasT family two-component response regulator
MINPVSQETNWAQGATGAVRAALSAVESEPELRLTLGDLDAILSGLAAVKAEQMQELRAEIENLKVALLSRATIEQAKGLLIAQSRITPDEAFQLLVRASQRENLKLRDLARRMVENAGPRPDAKGSPGPAS